MSTAPTRAKGRGREAFDTRKIELGNLFDKLPPHALESEAALLGSMILDWRVCGEVLQLIGGPEDFYKASHSAIYETLIELYDQHQSIDMVQLHQRLKDKQLLDQVGGVDYLMELAESVPTATSAGYYARIVREKSLLRRLIEAAGQVLYDAYNSAEPAGEVIDKAEQAIFRLAESRTEGEATALGQLAQEVYTRLENEDGRSVTGVETGFFELDEMTNGLQKGEMIIVAARPSMGKTAFALNIAEHIAVVGKQPVAVFSLEMSKDLLAQRLLCSRSSVDAQKLRRNMLSADDFGKLSLTVGELSEAPLFIDDQPGLSLLELRAKARRLAVRHDIQAIFVDYMQLMSAPGAESRSRRSRRSAGGSRPWPASWRCRWCASRSSTAPPRAGRATGRG